MDFTVPKPPPRPRKPFLRGTPTVAMCPFTHVLGGYCINCKDSEAVPIPLSELYDNKPLDFWDQPREIRRFRFWRWKHFNG